MAVGTAVPSGEYFKTLTRMRIITHIILRNTQYEIRFTHQKIISGKKTFSLLRRRLDLHLREDIVRAGLIGLID
jgi:hypothetical protein